MTKWILFIILLASSSSAIGGKRLLIWSKEANLKARLKKEWGMVPFKGPYLRIYIKVFGVFLITYGLLCLLLALLILFTPEVFLEIIQ